MVHRNSAVEIGQDGAAIFVDGQQELSIRNEIEAVDIGSVGEGESIRSITGKVSLDPDI